MRRCSTRRACGVAHCVAFHVRDAAALERSGDYDLVHIFESLHDMSYPVEVRSAARGLLADGGVVLVGDERVGEVFAAPADDLERFYSASTPQSAGFSSVEIAPVDNDFYRYYRLTP